MTDRVPLEDELAAMPLFRGLSRDDIEMVADSMMERGVKAGKTVMKRGQWGHELVVVLDGSLDVIRDDQVIARLGPGDHVGELAVLEDARRNATVVARTPARLGTVEYGQVRVLLHNLPELADRITRTADTRRDLPE